MGYETRTAVLVGQRRLDQDAWRPFEEPLLVAVEIAKMHAESGTGFEFGMVASYDRESGGVFAQDALIVDAFGGLRKEWDTSRVRPFFGVGGALTYNELSGGFAPDSLEDLTLGGYAHVGVMVPVGEGLDLVLDLRYRAGRDLEVGGTNVDSDYLILAAGLSF